MKPSSTIVTTAILAITGAAHAGWEAYDKSDPITDARMVSRFVNADPAQSESGAGLFGFVCSDNNPIKLILSFGPALRPTTTTDVVWVVYRVDKNKPVDSYWWMSKDKRVLTMVLDEQAKTNLRRGSLLAARFSNNKGAPLTAVFDIAGIDDVVAEVEKRCSASP